jgi:hypothetical protein
MNELSVALSFDPLLFDYLAAERLYYASTRWPLVDRIVAAALFVLGAVLVWAVGLRWWSLVWFPLAVLEWLNAWSLRPLQVWFSFKANPKFRERYQLVFSDSCVQFKTGSIDSELSWSFYSNVLEDDSLFLLVYGRHAYTVIPKRAFLDSEELSRFRELLARSLGGDSQRRA